MAYILLQTITTHKRHRWKHRFRMEFRWESPTRRDSENLELHLIPNEVYLQIFAYLYPSDSISEVESRRIFLNIASVCRFFAIHALPSICRSLTLDARVDAKKRLQNVTSLYRKARRGDALARYMSQLVRTCTIANWRGRGAFADMTEMLLSVPNGLASVTTVKVANCTLSQHILDAVFMVPSLTTLHIAFCTWDHTVDEESLGRFSELTSTLSRLALIGLSDSTCLMLLPHITVTKVVQLDTDNEHVISHFAASQIPLRRLTIPRLARFGAPERLAERLEAFTTLTEFTLTQLEFLPTPIYGPRPRFPLSPSALPALRKLTCPASIASKFGTNSRPHLVEAAIVGETINHGVRMPMQFPNSLSTFRVDNLRSLAFPFYCLKPHSAPFNVPYPALEKLTIQNYSRDRDSKVDSWMLASTIEDLIVICASSSFLPPIRDLDFRFAHSEKHHADTGALLVGLERQRFAFGNVAQFCFPTVERISITPYICWQITDGNWKPKVLDAELMKTAMKEFSGAVVDYDGCLEGL